MNPREWLKGQKIDVIYGFILRWGLTILIGLGSALISALITWWTYRGQR
jgi:hypothetical protein